jgi:hypothetical protein
MKQYVPLILDTISAAALAVWLGGLVVIWAVLAPLGHGPGAEIQPWFVDGLRRFASIAEACGIIVAAVQWALRRRYQKDRGLFVLDGLRMLVLFAALLCSEYGKYLILPAMTASKTALGLSTLTVLADVQGAALAGFIAMTIRLQTPQSSASPKPASVPAAAQPDVQMPVKASPRPVRRGKR